MDIKLEIKKDDYSYLLERLPDCYDYEIIKFEDGPENGHFSAKISFKINEIDEWRTFLEAYKSKNNERFRLSNVRNNTGPTLILRGFNCHFNAQKKHNRNRKNLDCPAKFSIVVRRKADGLMCFVSISFHHNHDTNVPEAVRKLSPCPEVIAKFTELFQQGVSPSEAFLSHEKDMRELYGETFGNLALNRRICPDQQWVYKQYYEFHRKLDKEVFFQILEKLVSELNLGNNNAWMLNHVDEAFTIVVVSPLMKRVGATSLAGEVCYFDSFRGHDMNDCRILILSCRTAAGCLPIGLLVTNSDSNSAVTDSLQCLKLGLGVDCFGGRGTEGPKIFECNCSVEERESLRVVYPLTDVQFSCVHILKDIWRLLHYDNDIPLEDKISLYVWSRNIIYTLDKSKICQIFERTMRSSLFQKYLPYQRHFARWFYKRNEWAPCLRNKPYIQFDITEGCAFILKDRILNNHRLYSPAELIRLLTIDFSKHLESKVTWIAANSKPLPIKRKYVAGSNESLRYTKLNDYFGEIRDSKTNESYLINADLGSCTCNMEDKKNSCRHLDFYIICSVDSRLSSFSLVDTQKDDLHFIGTGERRIRNELVGGVDPIDTALVIEDVATEYVLP